ALWSWRATASARYLSTLAALGRTAIRVKLSLQVGQKGRNRFTLGIAITRILAETGGPTMPFAGAGAAPPSAPSICAGPFRKVQQQRQSQQAGPQFHGRADAAPGGLENIP